MEASRHGREGVSLVETLIALVLGLLLVQGALASLARFESARARLVARTDALVALRMGHHALRRETRHGVGGVDWTVVGDSMPIRAYRGVALVCQHDSTARTIRVSYRGERAPDPAKDSVLLVWPDGRGEVRAVVGVTPAPSPCPGFDSTRTSEWRLDPGAPRGFLVGRLFERGSYHLSGAALRYRRGSSGRQPLTPEIWSSETKWTASGSRVGLDLVPRDTLAGRSWSGFLAWLSR